MRKEWWLYVQKKINNPEKVSSPQETFEKLITSNGTIKSPSAVPISASSLGLIFSGSTIGVQTSIFYVLLGFAVVGNFLYYGYAIIQILLAYLLQRKQQKYDHSKSKEDADQYTMIMKQKEWDHEKEMKQMEWTHEKEMKEMEWIYEKEMKQMDAYHEEKMKQLDNVRVLGNTKNDVNNMIPPVNAAESPRYDN